jgi:PAS domain S-box-containing protein
MREIEKKSDEQKAAEAKVEAFRKHLGPFVVAAETTRMPMIFADAKDSAKPIIFANDAFLALTGYDRKDVLGQSFDALMVRGATADALARVQAAFDGTSDDDPVIHYRRKDSSAFWASIYVSPVRNGSGDVQQYFVSFIDLTKHKEEHARALMLIDELNHRVKNTLQAVQSIVVEAFRKGSESAVIRESIESRVYALSRSHDLLMSEDWEGAGLRELVAVALEPFTNAEERSERVRISGDNIHLSPRTTLALGVAFHELATNAVKFGAFSTAAGSILVRWITQPTPDGPRLNINWRENGGPPVAPPVRKGFGTRVIEQGLAAEMDGTVVLDFPVDGVTCTINIPMPRDPSPLALAPSA